MKKYAQWLLVGFVAFVFIQSLFFKFSGSEETVIIFNTIGEWMLSIGLPAGLAEAFAKHGGNVIGSTELFAVILLLIPASRLLGALLSLGVISGAIFFHLFTPLGVNRVIDAAGNTDGGALFYMACGVWICSAILIWLNRPQSLR
jgi:hypothetical protein